MPCGRDGVGEALRRPSRICVVPAPGCGRTRKAGIRTQQRTRPNTICGEIMSRRSPGRTAAGRARKSRPLEARPARAPAPCPGDHVGAQQWRRDRGAVALTASVGAEVGELLGRGRPVPDDVVGALAGLGLVVAARHRIGEEQFARRQTIGVVGDQLGADRLRDVALVELGAPGDVAGIVRMQDPAGTARAPWSARRRRRSEDRRARGVPSAKIAVTPDASCSMRPSDLRR